MCKSDFPFALQWERRIQHVLVHSEGGLHFNKFAFKYRPSRSFRLCPPSDGSCMVLTSAPSLSEPPAPLSVLGKKKGMNEPRNNSCPGRISRLQSGSQVGIIYISSSFFISFKKKSIGWEWIFQASHFICPRIDLTFLGLCIFRYIRYASFHK